MVPQYPYQNNGLIASLFLNYPLFQKQAEFGFSRRSTDAPAENLSGNYSIERHMKIKPLFFTLFACMILLPYAVPTQKKAAPRKEIAIQLYSVRDLLGNPANRTEEDYARYTAILKKLAQMGYTAVEAAGYDDGKFYNRTPLEFKKDVENAGLSVLSSHCTKALSPEELSSGDFTESLQWWDKAIQAHKAAGMTYIVTPWMEVPATVKDLQTYCEYYNEIGRRCKQNGLTYGYHNHAHEFQKVEDRVVMMDYLIQHTDPEYVFMEMDLYWVVIGKSSPVDYFHQYPGRFKVWHIKDHREVGQSGMVGFDAIFKNAETAGVKHLVVEVENYSGPVEESIQTSIDYLLNAPFVKTRYTD